jgi:hypothetical protein
MKVQRVEWVILSIIVVMIVGTSVLVINGTNSLDEATKQCRDQGHSTLYCVVHDIYK